MAENNQDPVNASDINLNKSPDKGEAAEPTGQGSTQKLRNNYVGNAQANQNLAEDGQGSA